MMPPLSIGLLSRALPSMAVLMVFFLLDSTCAEPVIVEQDTLWTDDQSFTEEVIIKPNVTLAIQGSSAAHPLCLTIIEKGGFVVHPGATLYMKEVLVQVQIAQVEIMQFHAVASLHPNATFQAQNVNFSASVVSVKDELGRDYVYLPTRAYSSVARMVDATDSKQERLSRYIDWNNVSCQGFYECLDGRGLYAEIHDSVFFNNTHVAREVGPSNFSNCLFWKNVLVFPKVSGIPRSVSNCVMGDSSSVGYATTWTSSIFEGIRHGALTGKFVVDCLSFGNNAGFGVVKGNELRNVTAIENMNNLVVYDASVELNAVNLIQAQSMQLVLMTTTDSYTVNASVYWGKDLHSEHDILEHIKDGHSGGKSGFVTIADFAKKPFRHEILSRMLSKSNDPLYVRWEEYARINDNVNYSHSFVSDAVNHWLLHDEGIKVKDMPPVSHPAESSGIISPFGYNPAKKCADSLLIKRILIGSLLLNLFFIAYCAFRRKSMKFPMHGKYSYATVARAISPEVELTEN